MKFSKKGVQKAFAKSAQSYDDAAVLQKEVLARLLEKLKLLHPNPIQRVLDLGSGTGLGVESLTKMYGDDSYFAYDLARAMLKHAQSNYKHINQHAICGDVEALPYQQNTFDIVFSASTFQWCNDITDAFNASHEVLREGGLLLFSTFGPRTLIELSDCFAKVDNQPHVSSFVDIQTLGDCLFASGFNAPVMESEVITVEYPSPTQLFKDLQATGATNQLQQRERGLMSKSRFNKMLEEYEKLALSNGKYPASYEVIYGHGWKRLKEKSSQIGANEWQPIVFN